MLKYEKLSQKEEMCTTTNQKLFFKCRGKNKDNMPFLVEKSANANQMLTKKDIS